MMPCVTVTAFLSLTGRYEKQTRTSCAAGRQTEEPQSSRAGDEPELADGTRHHARPGWRRPLSKQGGQPHGRRERTRDAAEGRF